MSHETRTSPPTYPEVLDIHDGAFSESIWGSDGFRTIKVSGQSDVVADSYKDDLTIAAGTNVTITTNASGDSVTIASTPYTAGNGLQLSGNEFSVTALAITSVQEAANQTAHLALTTQQGDVVVRADENKSYVRNAGTAGDMSDFTLLKTPTDLVLSVHGNTGAITANQIRDAVEAATDSNTFTDDDHSKLNAIEASATADQTSTEIKSLLASDKLAAGHIADNAIDSDHYVDGSIDHIHLSADCIDSDNIEDNAVDSEHYVDGSIDTAHIADDAVTLQKIQNISTSRILGRISGGGGDAQELTAANVRTVINVEDGADVTDATNVTSAGAVMKTTCDAKGDILAASAGNTVTRLAVGSNDKVLTADSNEATGLKWATPTPGELNQNAFSTVVVSGQDNVAADSATDTLNLAAGSNVTITTNATSDTVTIAASNTNAAYMEKAGGTFTGDVTINDNEEIRVGSDNDLVIVHNGTDGFIKETTGTLDIRAKNTSGGLVTISDSAGENLIKCTAGSSVELTYDGTKKFETTTNGWKSGDGVKGVFGTGDDLQIYHSGSASFIDDTGDGALVIRSNNAVDIKDSDNVMMAAFNKDADVKLYHNGNVKLETTAAGVDITGQMGSDTIHVPDGSTGIQVGNSNDLKIFHDGTDTHIHDDTSATLVITNNDLRLKTSGDETMLRAVANDTVKLMYDNSTKFETQSTGIKVTGSDSGDQIKIVAEGTNAYGTIDFESPGTGGGWIKVQGENAIKIIKDGAVDLYHNNVKKFETTNTGINVTDTITATGTEGLSASLYLIADDGDDNGDGWRINSNQDANDLTISNNTSGSYVDKLTLTNGGALTVGGLTYPTSDGSNGQVLTTNGSGTLSFSSTAGGGLSDLVDDTSPQLGGDLDTNSFEILLDDDHKIKWGAGTDLEIWHSNSDATNYISSDLGGLWIKTAESGKEITLESADDVHIKSGSDFMAKFVGDAGVELYYDNSKKLYTHSAGVSIDGNLSLTDADSRELRLGAGSDLKLYHNGSTSIVEDTTSDLVLRSTNDDVIIQAADDIFIRPQGGEEGVIVRNNGVVELYHNNILTFQTESDGASIIGPEGGSAFLTFKADEGDDNADYFDVGVSSGGVFSIQNKASGSWDTNIECNGSGNVELYYDDSKKLATKSNGIDVIGNVDITGSVGISDSEKIVLGGDLDLQIYHDGTDAIIYNTTNKLRLRGDDIWFRNAADNEQLAKFTNGAGVELYFNDSRKFETNSFGIKVYDSITYNGTGTVDHKVDDQKTVYGTNDDLSIYHESGVNRIDSDVDLYIRKGTSENMAKFHIDGAVKLYYDGSNKLETSSAGITISGDLTFADSSAHDIQLQGGKIYGETAAAGALTIQSTSGNSNHAAIIVGENHNSDNGGITFYGAGSSTAEVKMRIRGNTDTIEIYDDHKLTFGDNSDLKIYHDGNHSYVEDTGAGELRLAADSGVRITKGDSETQALFTVDGASELYYNNVKKLETTSAGGTLTGTWTGVGKILQVVSCPKTDHATHTTDDTWNDITGVDQAGSGSVWCCKITPSSASNKILVLYDISISMDGHSNVYHGVRLMRDSTAIHQGANSRDGRATKEGTGSTARMNAIAGSYVDSPSSTSELTYKLQTYHHNHAISINLSDNDATNDYDISATSNITLMEVSG